MKFILILVLCGVVGFTVLATASQFAPGTDTAAEQTSSPKATVDDVYAAISAEMNGATPDFQTQVKPVLDLNLTYRELQAFVKQGGIASLAVAAAAAASATAAPTAPVPARPATRTVPMTKVLDIVRSQWADQPQPVCVRGATCVPLFAQLSAISCDRTGDVAVPATVSCTYRDSTLSGTISIDIDDANIVRWRGCSTSTRFLPYCLQAAPTAAPIATAPPANGPAGPYCGTEFISVSITDRRPHPVQIWIDGLYVNNDIVNNWRVRVGSHTVRYIYADGQSVISSGYVDTCKSWVIRVS